MATAVNSFFMYGVGGNASSPYQEEAEIQVPVCKICNGRKVYPVFAILSIQKYSRGKFIMVRESLITKLGTLNLKDPSLTGYSTVLQALP